MRQCPVAGCFREICDTPGCTCANHPHPFLAPESAWGEVEAVKARVEVARLDADIERLRAENAELRQQNAALRRLIHDANRTHPSQGAA